MASVGNKVCLALLRLLRQRRSRRTALCGQAQPRPVRLNTLQLISRWRRYRRRCWHHWRYRRLDRYGRLRCGGRCRCRLRSGLRNWSPGTHCRRRNILDGKRRNGTAPLLCESRQVLLTRLQRRYFLARGVLKVHAEPQDGNKEPGSPGNDVLGDLATFFRTQFRNSLIVCLNFGADGSAIHVSILRLHDGDRIWLASRARSKHARQCYWRDQCSQFQLCPPTLLCRVVSPAFFINRILQ